MIFKLGILLLAAYVSCEYDLDDCECGRMVLPVCGSDGATYDSSCYLECAKNTYDSKLTLAHKGACTGRATRGTDAAAERCTCPDNYTPVCGSDGKTYSNQCILDCHTNVQLRHRGKCETSHVHFNPDCVCTRNQKPVCGSDGVTYANPCILNCNTHTKAGLTMKHEGACGQAAVAN